MEDKLFGMIEIPFAAFRLKMSVFTIAAVAAFAFSDLSLYPVLIVLAAACHELGHIIAAKLCGRKIEILTIYPFGADMRISGGVMPYKTELIVSSAGIIVNLLLCTLFLPFASEYTGFFALSNLALAMLNLIPVKGLDGGHIADCLLYMKLSYETAQKLSEAFSYVGFMLLCMLAAASAMLSDCNLSLVFMCAYLLVAVYCKEAALKCV